MSTEFTDRQQAFVGFVLAHYVTVGVEELDQQKLTPLLRLRYHDSIADAIAGLGKPEEIAGVFLGSNDIPMWMWNREHDRSRSQQSKGKPEQRAVPSDLLQHHWCVIRLWLLLGLKFLEEPVLNFVGCDGSKAKF